jgi:probable HAF family extracellular repeat protein
MTDLGTLGGSTSLIRWLNDVGEVVGGANTTNDNSFHATLWKNGRIIDLGVLDGDCSSVANAINSSGRIVGKSNSCDRLTSRAVLKRYQGPSIDLGRLAFFDTDRSRIIDDRRIACLITSATGIPVSGESIERYYASPHEREH